MEIIKQPLTQGVLLPMGEACCCESSDMAEGCGDRQLPSSSKRLCSAPIFFPVLAGWATEGPAQGQTPAEELQETGPW